MKIEKEYIYELRNLDSICTNDVTGYVSSNLKESIKDIINLMEADLEKPTETTKGTIEAPTAEEVSWAIDTIETLTRVEKCEQEYTADEQHPSAKIGISDEIKTKLYTKEMQPNCTEPSYSSEPVPKQYHPSRMDYFVGKMMTQNDIDLSNIEGIALLAKEAIKQIDELG